MTKRCFKCGKKKELDEFYVDARMNDGHLGKCKDCTKTENNAKYQENWLKRQGTRRSRRNRSEARETDRATRLEYRRRPEVRAKNNARLALKRAVDRGELIRGPCQRCGSTSEVEGHHFDYSKALDVEWLCRACHLTGEHGKRYHTREARS